MTSQADGAVCATDILIVDDQDLMRRVLDRMLGREGYRCREADSVRAAKAAVSDAVPDLILCDIDMPEESGLVLVDWLAEHHPEVAVLMVTACDDPAVAAQVFGSGADGYIIKPFERNEILINVEGSLRRHRADTELRARQASLQLVVDEQTSQIRNAVDELEHATETLDHSYQESVWRLACAAEYRDPETASHLERMSRYSELLGRALGMDESWCDLLRLASPMHDVGKLGIPDEILLKTGRFTDEDRAIMNRHAEIGHRILSGSDSPLLQMAATIAHTHHEWWDGGGYPRALRGSDIPIEGRIVAVADVFDALTSKRRYKEAISLDEAELLMRAESGGHFDPELIDAFFGRRAEIEAIRHSFEEADLMSSSP
jgi:putative two-component system response regulator